MSETVDATIRALFEKILTKVVEENKSFNSDEVAKIIADLSSSAKANIDKIIDYGIQISKTENISKDFQEPNIMIFEYDKSLMPNDIKDLLNKQIIQKYHLKDELALLLSRLFERKDPDPMVFDGVFIQHYNRPIIYLKRKTSTDLKDGYSIFFEMTKLKDIIKSEADEGIYKLKLERAKYAINHENFKFFFDRSLIVAVIVGLTYIIQKK